MVLKLLLWLEIATFVLLGSLEGFMQKTGEGFVGGLDFIGILQCCGQAVPESRIPQNRQPFKDQL